MGRNMSSAPSWISSLSQSLSGWSRLTEVELQDKFNGIDVDSNGFLDKAEIVKALRGLGKSEAEIKKVTSSMPDYDTRLDFNEFKKLMQDRNRSKYNEMASKTENSALQSGSTSSKMS